MFTCLRICASAYLFGFLFVVYCMHISGFCLFYVCLPVCFIATTMFTCLQIRVFRALEVVSIATSRHCLCMLLVHVSVFWCVLRRVLLQPCSHVSASRVWRCRAAHLCSLLLFGTCLFLVVQLLFACLVRTCARACLLLPFQVSVVVGTRLRLRAHVSVSCLLLLACCNKSVTYLVSCLLFVTCLYKCFAP